MVLTLFAVSNPGYLPSNIKPAISVTINHMKKARLLKYILVFCVLLSGLPVFVNELLYYIFKDVPIAGALLYLLIMTIVVILCLGFGVFFAIRLFKQKLYATSTWPVALLVLAATYTFVFITYGYRQLLSTWQFELLLLASAFLIPSLIMTLALLTIRPTGSSLRAIAVCLFFFGIVSFALFSTSRSFTYTYEESQLLGSISQAAYTYYLPSPKVMDPSRIKLYTGGVDFKKGVGLTVDRLGTDDTTPTYISIEERPRHVSDISAACGTEIVTTYLSKSTQPDSYRCTMIAQAADGPIYELSYGVPSFSGMGTRVKEYVLIAKDTYVYATYNSLSLTQPRIYDQATSVTLLQGMQAVEPAVFLKRMVALELQ